MKVIKYQISFDKAFLYRIEIYFLIKNHMNKDTPITEITKFLIDFYNFKSLSLYKKLMKHVK